MSNSPGTGSVPPIDTKPDTMEPPPELVRAAMRYLPTAFNDAPKAHYHRDDPGEKTANYWEVVERLAAAGHSRSVAEWAVHEHVRAGRLVAEPGMLSLPTLIRPDARPLPERLFGSLAYRTREPVPSGPSVVPDFNRERCCLRATPAFR